MSRDWKPDQRGLCLPYASPVATRNFVQSFPPLRLPGLWPPLRSLGHCGARPRGYDPGEGVGAHFLPRHGTSKKIRRVRRSARPCPTPPCRGDGYSPGVLTQPLLEEPARACTGTRIDPPQPHIHWWTGSWGQTFSIGPIHSPNRVSPRSVQINTQRSASF